ncbi:MAG: glycosyltransferase family 39 protein [Planctomycetota bacterium]
MKVLERDKHGWLGWTGALAVVAAAVLLRLYGLGRWSFGPREFDSLVDRIAAWKVRADIGWWTRPLDPALWLDRLVFFPELRQARRVIVPDLELWTRLPAAIAGILAVVLILTWGRRRLGIGIGTCSAALVAVSPLLIFFSQLATHHSLAFFASTICLVGFSEILEKGGWRWAIVVAVSWFVAASASPSAYLLLALITLSALAWYLRESDKRRLKPLIAAAAMIGSFVLASRIVQGQVGALTWLSTANQVFSRPELGLGELLAWVRSSIGLPVVLLSIAVVPSLFGGLRPSRWWIPIGVGFGLVLLLVGPLALRVPVEGMPCVLAPVFLAAGAGLSRILGWLHRAHPLLSFSFGLVVVLLNAPDWASYYRDGNRYDFREVVSRVRELESELEEKRPPEQRDPDRYTYSSDEPRVARYYLQRPGKEPQVFSISQLGQLVNGPKRLRGTQHWVILTSAGAERLKQQRPRLLRWIHEHCWKHGEIRSGRFDHWSFSVEIYRGLRPVSGER